MTHADAFLAAIIVEPDADVHRLVMADWLDENGQAERADFIRAQCALAAPPWRVGRVYDDPAWLRLHAREQELLSAEQDRVREEWRPLAGPGADVWWDAWAFRRGFVAEVTLPCQAWLEHGPALVRAAPLERVTLSDRQPSRWYRLGWGEWYWVRQAGPTPHVPDGLPPELCALLSTGRVDEDGVMTYLSRERAQDALSRACLGWARDAMVPGRREGV
jgi:uncharacterized protein (TIGR02996 family)